MIVVAQDGGNPIRLPRENPADPDSPARQPESGRDYEIIVPPGTDVEWDTPGDFGSQKSDSAGRVRIPVPRGSGGQALLIWLIIQGKSHKVRIEIKPETT